LTVTEHQAESPAVSNHGPQSRDHQVLAGPAPCDNCRVAARCKAERLASGCSRAHLGAMMRS